MSRQAAASVRLVAVTSLQAVEPAAWDALVGDDNPFVEHAFLYGLEVTGCVGPSTAWQPLYLLATDEDPQEGQPIRQLHGAVPCYLKGDSLGEFIFDWNWAHFFHTHGRPYYPKLVVAVPFTPVEGPRLLLPPAPQPGVADALLAGVRELTSQVAATGAHWLYVNEHLADCLAERGWFRRLTTQARWFNPGYRDFDDFLATRNSRSRKQIRRERRDVRQHGLDLQIRRGPDLEPEAWQALHRAYEANADKHGNEMYLNEAFFQWLRDHLAHRVVGTFALGPTGYVGAALFLCKGRHLYGRYWGCWQEHPFLHFELGYYLPMDFCIQHGLSRFEAGAGGEHKLQRGMHLAPIHSAHWLADPNLAPSVAAHVAHETVLVRAELDDPALSDPTAKRGP